jgi:hypothetical protein
MNDDDLLYCRDFEPPAGPRCSKAFSRVAFNKDFLIDHLGRRHLRYFNSGDGFNHKTRHANRVSDMIQFVDNVFANNDYGTDMLEDEDGGGDNFPLSSQSGTYSGSLVYRHQENVLVVGRKVLDHAGAAETNTYSPIITFPHVQSLQHEEIINRYNSLSAKKRSEFNFYWRAMHSQRNGCAISALQKAIDLDYWHHFTHKRIELSSIKSSRLRKSIEDKTKMLGTQNPEKEQVLPNLAKSLYHSARGSVLKVLGEYLNLFQVEISVMDWLVRPSMFYFVNPVPLCFLNLAGLEMREQLNTFKEHCSDSALFWNEDVSTRTRCRLGTTAEGIIQEHYRRAATTPKYANSHPLLIRIFLDGAVVSSWKQASQTPILMTIGNMHPDLQVTMAAKVLIGYYPEIHLEDDLPIPQQAVVRQQVWHAVMGEIIECFEQ